MVRKQAAKTSPPIFCKKREREQEGWDAENNGS